MVPSLDEGIQLAEDLPDDDATIDREGWQLIVGIGSGTTVRSLGEQLGMRELPILRATRGMVDRGLAVIGAGSPRSGGRAASKELPTLDDESEAEDLFDDATSAGADELPEPLPGRSGSAKGSVADPFSEAADSEIAAGGAAAPLDSDEATELEEQMERLADEHRELLARAAEAASPEEAEEILDDLPADMIDRDLMRRFLGSVRS